MRILVLMKRFGTNKDLVVQNFGRQIRLFEQIKKFGHDVDFLCMDQKRFESKKIRKKNIDYYIEPLSITKFAFFKKFSCLLSTKKYDIIVASTSPILGIIGYFFSRKHKIKMLYDLQDSFDVYDEYKIPFIRQIDKYVTKNSEIVICVSQTLVKKIKEFRKKPTYIVQNGIESNLFRPQNKIKCRKHLKLPLKSKIIVYMGHLSNIKGFDVMLDAFKKIRQKYPSTYLLLSGQIDKDIDIKQENIIFRVFPERRQVVLGINAADVAILPNPINDFTKYCFPYKILEYMACNVPIVATDVGDVSLLLTKYKGSLCKPSDAKDLSEKIMAKLEYDKRVAYNKDIKQFRWNVLAEKLNSILNELSG